MNRPVLLLAPFYSPHVRRFLEAIAGSGWPALFAPFTGMAGGQESRALPEGSCSVDWLGAREPFELGRARKFQVALQEVIDQHRPSLVLAGPIDSVGLVAAELTGAPIVQMSHGSDLLAASLKSLQASGVPAALESAAGIFVDCAAGERIAVSVGADPQKVWKMPWGVDLSEFPAAPWVPVRDELRFISLRSLERIYDPLTLVRGFAGACRMSRRRITLSIAGDGSMQGKVRREVEQLGIDARVRWLGRVPESELPEVLAQHHVHVSAALSDGSSISQLQAFATGRPSVASDIPANREWIRHGDNGFLFEIAMPTALANVLSDCANRELELPALGRSARATAERAADWRENVTQWLAWLRRIGR